MIQCFEKPMRYRQYLQSLLPSVLTMIFLSFYTTIDGYFVSRYAGSDALAGINIVVPITCVTFGVAVMLATGAGAIIGECLGRGETERADRIFSFMCVVLLVFAAAFTAAGLLFLRPIAVLLGSSERLMPHVLPYAFVVFLSTVPMAFKLFFEYLVRSDGNASVGLAMSVVGLVLNVGLDYLFVGVLGMGTLGAAWGTCLSITASALIGLVYFLRFGHIRFARPRADWRVLLKSCTNGSSEMFTELSTGITTLLFNLLAMRYFGEDGVAAVTIIMYIYYFFISCYMGIAVAVAPVVSYNVGAKNLDKIREQLRYSFRTITTTAALILAASLLGGPAIIHLFVENGTVFNITWEALKLFSPVFLFIGYNVFLSGYFTALGNGRTSAIISLLRSLILVVVFIAVLPLALEERGVWLTMPCSETVTVLVALWLYRREGRPPEAAMK